MPTNCNCGGQEVEIGPAGDGDWLGGLCKFTGVELRIPRGVWFQRPLTEIFDFIKKVDGKLPEDNLEWVVDEEKVKNYEKQFGAEGMLFSAADFMVDTVKNMGITREQWKDRFKEKLPNGDFFYPDPIILLAVARDFWRRFPNAVVIHHPSGRKVVFGVEQLKKLNELEKLLNSGQITREQYSSRAKEIFSSGRGDSKSELEDKLKFMKDQFEKGLIPKDIYEAKVKDLLSKFG